VIRPIILPAACERVDWHREHGHTLLIITATNAFVTRPIADALGIPNLLATEPECLGQRYTGRYLGTPTFRDGKVQVLHHWLANNPHSLADSWFYSDSHNDLPLLEQVARPVAVDPDRRLREVASARGWEIRSFREA
jgi:HAD superfamily hydrolase (TIGR01490 family)